MLTQALKTEFWLAVNVLSFISYKNIILQVFSVI